MRGDREHFAPPRGVRWRRYAAALLAALLALYSTLAFAGTGADFADPEICRSQPADDGDGAGDRGHRHLNCLLCLPGCATLAAGDASLALGPSVHAIAPLAMAGTRPVRAERRHAPYRPRGPPA